MENHHEAHFQSPELLRDIVLGMSDGLTVPFALAAGLSGAVQENRLIVIAGMAELLAGAIAMGLGGYLAARSEAEHYSRERRREAQEVREIPEVEKQEVVDVFRQYGLGEHEVRPIVDALARKPNAWIDFMMRFELGLEKPQPNRARRSAATIGISYIVGGLVPLSPYFSRWPTPLCLQASIAFTCVALFAFGYVKGRFASTHPLKSAFQTLGIGALAAAAAFSLARCFASP